MTPDMRTAALSYAQRGWPVLPLHNPAANGCSFHRGLTCTAVGKHPRTKHGLSDATTDQTRIEGWWDRWPDANIGILTGAESGLLVIDIDNKDGRQGGDNLAALASRFGGLPATLTATTGNGQHLFFSHPGIDVSNSAGTLATGIDVRAERGYVVAAPSLHANGSRYAWVDGEQPIAEVPSFLLSRITGHEKEITAMNKIDQNASEVAPKINEGERNDELFDVGCSLRGQLGKNRDQILSILHNYNMESCNPPLDRSEVIAITDSICKRYPAESGPKKSAKRKEQNPLYWFKFNTRDWFSNPNVMLMSDAQTGWYIRLKALAWDSGGFLPLDHDKLWKLAGARSKKAFEQGCEPVLAEYEGVVVEDTAMYRHPQLAAEYADTLQLWMKKKEAAEARINARPRALNYSNETAMAA